MLKAIFSDGIFALFNKICYFGVKTLSIILITRELGVQDGGTFIFLVGLLEILRLLADFGVDVYVIKKYTGNVDKFVLLNHVFFQKITTGLVLSVVFMCYGFYSGYSSNIFVPVAIALLFSMFYNLPGSFYQSQNANRTLTPIVICATIITMLALLICYIVKFEFSAWHYLLVEVIFVSLVMVKLFTLSKGKWTFKFISFKDIFWLYSKTKNIGFNAIIVIVYSRLDNFYIKNFDPNSLASYGQIFRLIDPLVMISSVFSTVAYARFSHYDLRYSKHFYKILPFMACVILYGLISSTLYYVAINLFGRDFLLYTESTNVIIVCFLIVATIKCINGALTALIQSQGLYQLGLYTASVCIIVAAPLMYFLTVRYGAVGAVYTIMLVESISCLLLLYCVLMMRKSSKL